MSPPARRLALAAALPALVPVVVFAKALLGRALLAPGDGFIYYLPVHILTARAWRAGELPGWNEYAFSGSPLLASAQAGPFYPPNVLFLFLPALYANNLVVVFDVAAAGVGTFLFARKLTGDAAGAAVAGVAFASCGFVYGHVAHQSMEASLAWLPWMLYGWELLRDRASAARACVAAGAVALSLLGGHYQISLFALVVFALYALATSSGRTGRVPWWALPATLGAGVGLAAVQIVPTLAILGHTLRGHETFAFATSYSFSPSHLVLLAFPYLFGTSAPSGPFHAGYTGQWNLTELAGYPGLAAVVLAAAGWERWRHDRRALAVAVVAGLALLVALGGATPVGRLVWHVPVVGRFRAWARYVAALDLAVAVLAAYGVAQLRSARGRRGVVARGAAVVVALVALALLSHALNSIAPRIAPGWPGRLALVIPVAAAGAAVVLCTVSARAPAVAAFLCGLLVAADGLASFGGFYEWRSAPTPEEMRHAYSQSQPPAWGATPAAPGGITRYLFAGNSIAALGQTSPQVTAVKRIRSASGLDPLAPTPYSPLVGDMQDAGNLDRPGAFLAHRSPLLDVLRVSLVVVPANEAPRAPPPWFRRPRRIGSLVRYEYRPRVSDAFLIGRTLAVDRYRPFDPRREAIVAGACETCPTAGAAGRAGRVVSERRRTGEFDVDVEASRRALLVVSEDWYPGWSATVDGQDAHVVRADGVVLGVPIPPGTHRVRLRYRVPGLTLGAAVSLATLALLVAAGLVAPRLTRAARRG